MADYVEKLRLVKFLELLNLEKVLLYRTIVSKAVENSVYYQSNFPNLIFLNDLPSSFPTVPTYSPYAPNVPIFHPLLLEILIRNYFGSTIL